MSRPAAPDPIQNASADAVRQLLDTSRQDELTLLDVRLEPEYEEFHLPGARLMPLPDLPDHLEALDRDRPVVVYCRSGGRSAAAAKLLAGAGFPRVVNMLGGVMAWQGAAAVGAPDAGMTLLRGDEAPEAILRAALAMEAALGGFYRALAGQAPDADTRAAFERLAGFEERHLHYVHTLYRKATGDETELAALLSGASGDLEGGLPGARFLEQLGGAPASAREALELAASVEAQALDLYARLARKADAPESAALYATLAQEEKAHLRAVSNLMKQLA
ncbi:rhodanese-like domain-containing protein [Solidesulfovibrio sp.]|uniref:rhodanese-like domain-containing protein n=1 Tax=Solidesulfovibrio sp. TaxID=2910990 RepID=UPI002B1F92C3|nr:rhodanese-like domain-containing protein [Solidesulfovibrio sp.]MEA4857801.1 rhodanese-like domain-containing protein [Solidesulfovibrio sp.]